MTLYLVMHPEYAEEKFEPILDYLKNKDPSDIIVVSKKAELKGINYKHHYFAEGAFCGPITHLIKGQTVEIMGAYLSFSKKQDLINKTAEYCRAARKVVIKRTLCKRI